MVDYSYSQELEFSNQSTQRQAVPYREIAYINLASKEWTSITLQEALELRLNQQIYPFILYFVNLSIQQIQKVRKAFQLHPVIDNECCTTVFNVKDQMLFFNDHLLMTISYPSQVSLQQPLSVKFIYFQDFLLIFTSEDLTVFRDLLQDQDFSFSKMGGFMLPDAPEILEIGRKTSVIQIGNQQGCSPIESIFYNILDAMFSRLERFVTLLDCEAKDCVSYSTNLSVAERVEFIQKLCITEQHLIFLENLVKPKPKLLTKVKKTKMVSTDMKYYYKSMISRADSISQNLATSKKMIKTAEHIFNVSVEDTLTNSSNRLNSIMMHFSAIATIFLPLNLIGALFGMNVIVPGQEEESLMPFFIILVACGVLLVAVLVYFKNKGWME